MTRAADILFNLQTKIQMSNEKHEFTPSEIEEMFGPGFGSQYTDDVDVPNVSAVDTKYTTHRKFALPRGKKGGSNYLPFPSESAIQEEDEKKKDKTKDLEADADMTTAKIETDNEEVEEPRSAEIGSDEKSRMDLGDGADMGIGDIGSGLGIEKEESKTSGELGRIYELKKIYSRLTSIESYLSDESSGELTIIRNHVSQSIELFEIVSSNFDSYKEKLDEIIIMYYKFIMEVYETVKNYYKNIQLGD